METNTTTSTTKKNSDFMSSPLSKGNKAKLLMELPGIGIVTAKKLQNEQIYYIHQLIGFYLINNMDHLKLYNFLKEKGQMSERNLKSSVEAIEDYVLTHLGVNADTVEKNF